MKRRRGLSQIELVVATGIAVVLLSLLLPAINRARATARELMCSNRFRSVNQETHSFISLHRTFPGKNMPWTAQLFESEKTGEIFRCTVMPDDAEISNHAMNWEVARLQNDRIADGFSNTIMFAESESLFGARWKEGPMIVLASLSSDHPPFFHISLADGSVRKIVFEQDLLERLLSVDSGDFISID